MEVAQIAQLLNDTISLDVNVVCAATYALDRLSVLPHFPFSTLSIAAGGENQGQRVAAATYLKNFTRRNNNGDGPTSKVSKEFKDHLMQTLLKVEPAVLKALVEVFRIIVVNEFVEQNFWPDLVPDLRYAIWNSNLINNCANCQWNTINALTILHALIRPFQYFLNPKVAKEPVPPQLEQIAKEIIVPVLAIFHQFHEKGFYANGRTTLEVEKMLLLICKCIYFTVRSHMPSALIPSLPSICRDLIGLLDSLNFDHGVSREDGHSLRLKTGKRSLLVFCALVTRHRKYSDKLMPDIIKCVLKIVNYSSNISKLDFLSERIISLAFDVISHILETGPGWRLVSPHFSFLLDSAIFPALVLNEKDISEWEEDTEEYLRKNLPSELEEISGWRGDLFTARKSALNLLGVISMSKGPYMVTSRNISPGSTKRKKGEKNKRDNQQSSMGELLVLPFLSKFPIPSDANASEPRILNDYFGVLMAYGGMQDFLRELKPGHLSVLVRTRLIPLYSVSVMPPFLVAAANWVVGELASCLPDEMSVDIYSSLLKALAMPDNEYTCYPVRVSAAGAIVELLENDYPPPEWLPLLQVLISRINIEEEETSILFQLLNSVVEIGDENITDDIPNLVSSIVGALLKHMHPGLETWPQVVERGFSSLAVMTQSWENNVPEDIEQIESSEKWASGIAIIGKALSALLQQTWLTPVLPTHRGQISPTPTCMDDLSTLLRSIILSVNGIDVIPQLKLPDLLLVWANLIADWHAWEESEDMSVFDCIKEVVNLHRKYELKDFMIRNIPLPPAPPVPPQSIIEGIGAFVREAILQYPSATWRACSCVHVLLHVPHYSTETEGVKQSLAVAFGQAAFSRFKEIQSKPTSLWMPLLLVISSCYLCYPDTIEGILEKDVNGGITIWASALAFTCTSSFEPGLSGKSEIKLTVMTMVKIIEWLLGQDNLGGSLIKECFTALMEALVRLTELQEESEDEDDNEESEDNDEDDGDDYEDEDSEEDVREETEEEFLKRYAEAAKALDNGMIVEEGDLEDQEFDIELGTLKEVDEKRIVFSLIERFNHFLIQGQALSPKVTSSFISAFPECKHFFQQ